MSLLKKLASDTVAYGLSSILARLINYVFSFLIVQVISVSDYGEFTKFYAFAGFIIVVLTHGMETAFFRFRTKEQNPEGAFATAWSSIALVSLLMILFSYFFKQGLADWALVSKHPEYVVYFAWIMALDALAAIPFAQLRAKGRPYRFASIRIINILLYIFFMVLFLFWVPGWYANHPTHVALQWYNPSVGVGYVFIANLIASAITLLLLFPEIAFKPGKVDKALYKKMLPYALPVMLVGFAGMVNEMLDRVMMERLLPYSAEKNKELLGIYGFNYKFAMLMTLFLQAYRYAAEPLFFAQAGKSDAKKTYAVTMKYFMIAGIFIFMFVVLLMPFIQWILLSMDEQYAIYFTGSGVVPLLLGANLLLGIYFNISTWYKVTDKTHIGAVIAFLGAVVTIVLNAVLVPDMGYMGAAWATLLCYLVMVIAGYITERKYYPVPYPFGEIAVYVVLGLVLWGVHTIFNEIFPKTLVINTIFSVFLLGIYLLVSYIRELRHKKA